VNDVLLFDALRTPRTKGKPDGALATVTPYELVRQLAEALRARHGEAAVAQVERVALGCVTQAGAQGGHPALMARSYAALPGTAVATTVNNFCVSGISALAVAARSIALGEEQLALAGGVESMSQSPFEGDRAPYYADAELAARVGYVSPPIVGDLLATQEGLTREELDAVTVDSHRRAGQAWAEGRYASTVIPIRRPDGTVVDRDEMVRPQLAAADLARFPAAFAALGAQGHDAILAKAIPGLGEIQHLHAIPHCPPIADGAALLLVGRAARGTELGLRPRARIVANGCHGVRVHGAHPRARGTGPQGPRRRGVHGGLRRRPGHAAATWPARRRASQ
jgi:acetyl-CoA C-acetyltransferase